MKRGQDWSDKTFRALLHDHQGQAASSELRDRIEAAARQAQPVADASRFWPWPLVARVGALAAGLALVLGLAALALVLGSRFDQAMTVSDLAGGSAGSYRSDQAISLASRADQDLRVSGSGLTIDLSPSSVFELAPALPPLRWLGGEDLRIRLQTGGLHFIHQPGSASFVLTTPFGELRPLGTEFSLEVDAMRQDLMVTQGTVEFRESDGRRTVLGASQSLHLQRLASGEVEQVPVAPGSTAATSMSADPASSAPASPAPASPAPAAVPVKMSTAIDSAAAKPLPPPGLAELWHQTVAGASAGRVLLPSLDAGAAGLVVLAAQNRLIALDLGKGTERWARTLPAAPQNLVAGTGLLVQSGTSLQSLDWASGEARWTIATPPQSLNHPIEGGGSIWLASADGSLSRYAANDGQVGSRFKLDTGLYGNPLIVGSLILTSRLPDQFLALDRETGGVVWNFTAAARFAGELPLPNRDASLVWVRDSKGTWYGLESASGRERFRLGGSARLQFGPVTAAGRLWAQDDAGLFSLDDQGVRREVAGQPGTILALAEVPALPGRVLVASSAGAAWLDPTSSTWTDVRDGTWRQAAAAGKYLVSVDVQDAVTLWKVVP